ncbi:MAG: NYN domain-containing protein [Gemmatimonadetes bacterium]|nr:NYN domain-containing protein [Gemmatimonadota bacterium]
MLPGALVPHHAPNAALLIDFDNVTMGIRSDLQTELRNLLSSDIIHGKVAVQRAYADWRRYPQYIVPLSEASIDLIFAPAYGSSKKNATDIRLAIDAMELVFTRPEIGTIILLSGDSDFSSLVIKLKEYGKYVIGVGIRESSSDLLVQNCDEYYSYNALAGLVKANEEGGADTKYDPWELVTEAITRMVRNGDVMRSDRLKQVMQEIDSSFDEKDLGISKFSKFCAEAAQKGLILVTKLENGQLEVAPTKGAVKSGEPAATPAPRPAGAEVEEREGRRRGRRGGRGRGRREREEATGTAEQGAEVAPASVEVPVAAPVAAVAAVADVAQAALASARPAGRGSRKAGAVAVSTPTQPITAPVVVVAVAVPAVPAVPVAPVAVDSRRHREPRSERREPVVVNANIGRAGIRLTRDEAFALVRNAVTALVTGEDAVGAEQVRQKAFDLLGRDSESLNERNFPRILRDAHDGDVVDLRKRGDSYEVARSATAASVSSQIEVKEAELKAADDKVKAAANPPAPRGMVARGVPNRGGRGGKAMAPPPNFLLIGVVESASPKPAAVVTPVAPVAPVSSAAPAAAEAPAKKTRAKAAPKAAPKADAPAKAKAPAKAAKADAPAKRPASKKKGAATA